LDGEALHAIGIDVEAVRSRAEAAFGPGALERAAGSPRGKGGHLSVTRQARKCLNRSVRAARTDQDGEHGSEHIALALLEMDASVPRRVLEVLGVSAPQLAAEIRAGV
jgi:ATP-dependent Clp protease ATP-binding subunit ClpA